MLFLPQSKVTASLSLATQLSSVSERLEESPKGGGVSLGVFYTSLDQRHVWLTTEVLYLSF